MKLHYLNNPDNILYRIVLRTKPWKTDGRIFAPEFTLNNLLKVLPSYLFEGIAVIVQYIRQRHFIATCLLRKHSPTNNSHYAPNFTLHPSNNDVTVF